MSNVIVIAGLKTSSSEFGIIERKSVSFIPLNTVIVVAIKGKNNTGISLNFNMPVFLKWFFTRLKEALSILLPGIKLSNHK